jgi:hypothetical protein
MDQLQLVARMMNEEISVDMENLLQQTEHKIPKLQAKSV